MTYLFSFIVVLGILIFVHELGHFLAARLCGVGVERFSLGFGPRLFGKKIGITDYQVSAIPLGGYVKMIGEEPDTDIDPADIPLSFTHKHVIQRIIIVAAGPLFNFFLAVVIFFGFFQIYGTFVIKPVIGEVKAGAPAEKAGLKNGDQIVSIDGTAVTTWDDMANMITQSQGKKLRVTVRRRDAEIVLDITPDRMPDRNLFGEEIERYMIGISSSGDVLSIKLNPLQALGESLAQTYKISKLMIVGVVKLIKGDISTKNLGGPIRIVQMAGDQAKVGVGNLIFFIAFISINLGILNFLPIPVLDGGHLLFFFIEWVTGRPVNIKIREIAQQVGIFILILLMIFVFYNDISQIFFN